MTISCTQISPTCLGKLKEDKFLKSKPKPGCLKNVRRKQARDTRE